MRLKQLSVFLENSPGHLKHVCEILADAGINIETITIAESNAFGVMRAIVDKPDVAVEALARAGLAAKLVDVLAIEVDDKPGALLQTLQKAEGANLNIEYMYALTKGECGKPVMIMRFTDADKAEQVML